MTLSTQFKPDALEFTPAQPRLLVADGDTAHGASLQTYLTRQGYKVEVTNNGAEALERVAAHPPDLLILDLNLPDLSGLELTLRLRNDPQLNYLPVIIITNQAAERKRLQSMLSGADDYLPKPVMEIDLLVRVQALLRTKVQIDGLLAERRRLMDDLAKRNRELEEALAQVKEADMLKRNILNTVSHEMGTPMLQIKSAVHLLAEDVRKADPDSTPAALANQAIARLEGIIQNAADWRAART
ncbi:MAG: response regulator [Anaerolineae bacterium]|nr:response regulator [Anaerolineae bacterium]